MPMMVGQQTGGRDFRSRFFLMIAVMASLCLVLVTRLYVLQISRGEEYKEKSIDNFVKESRLPAGRGMVLDHRGRILVDNRPSYNVTLTPAFCQPSGAAKNYCLDEVLPRLATYLSLDAEEIARITENFKKARGLKRFREFTVKVDVEMDALDRLEANRLELAGVDILAVPHRNYRYGTLAAHVLGYMNEISSEELESLSVLGESYQLGDYVGRRGVERLMEKELRGADGSEKTVVDAKGRRIRNADNLLDGTDRLNPPVAGRNLVLSLNLPLQQAAENVFPGKAGSAVVVDVNTGFILAMVNRPQYDPNKLTGRISRAELKAISEDPLEPLLFRAAQQHYHPGSTFKVVTALAALEENIATKATTVSCNGGYNLGARRWRCHKDSGHGTVELNHALSWSCDTWFYTMADRMGIEPITRIGATLGLGHVSGLDLGPEVPGVLPSVEYHNKFTPGGYTKGLALNTAIGQGDTNVTPLQLAMLYAAIGNGGTLYKPQVVRRIEDIDGHLIRTIDPIVVDRLKVKPEHLAAVVEGLKSVVNDPGGTAYWKRLKDIIVAGKTGTAQVVALAAGRRLKEAEMDWFSRDHAWFASFAPADKPEIAVVVLNEHGGHGGADAAPAAMDIIKEYFRLKAEEEAAGNGTTPQMTPPPPPPPPAPSATPLQKKPA